RRLTCAPWTAPSASRHAGCWWRPARPRCTGSSSEVLLRVASQLTLSWSRTAGRRRSTPPGRRAPRGPPAKFRASPPRPRRRGTGKVEQGGAHGFERPLRIARAVGQQAGECCLRHAGGGGAFSYERDLGRDEVRVRLVLEQSAHQIKVEGAGDRLGEEQGPSR